MQTKTFIIVVLLIIYGFAKAQEKADQKNMVLIEIATGTWCGYCPGAAMAVDEMVDEGLSVAVIENHGGDSYETNESRARIDFYGIGSYPTAEFNGTEEYIGGGTSSIYSIYKAIYDKSVLEETFYSLDLTVLNLGNKKYRATVTSNLLSENLDDSIHLFIIVTESHIPESWMGQSELNFVNRLTIPGKEGFHICYSCSGSFYENFEFEILPDWNEDNMEVIAFIQDMKKKEVVQTNKAYLPEQVINNNVAVIEILEPANMACSSSISPEIIIQNRGINKLQSVTIEYNINNSDESYEYLWSGSLETDQTHQIVLPSVNFEGGNGNNTISVTLSNPNNADDEIPDDNYLEYSFEQFWQKSRFLQIQVSTDYNGDETSWELLNSLSEVVLSGSGYEAGQNYDAYFETNNNDCYSLKVYDSGNDGIDELGYVRLIDFYTQHLIYEVPEFDSESTVHFGTNYKFQKSIKVNNRYNNPISFYDTVFVSAYAKDTIVTESFSIINSSPLTQYLQIQAEIISGNSEILQSFMWDGNELSDFSDSLIIDAQGLYNDFEAVFRPNDVVGEKLVKYKVWVDRDTTDYFEWFVKFASKEVPPVVLQLMDSNNKRLESGDTVLVEDLAFNMLDSITKIYIENESLIDVQLKVKRTFLVKDEYHDFRFGWNGEEFHYENPDDAVILNPGDTISDFYAGFYSNNIPGNSLVRYTFYSADNNNDSVSVVMFYKVNENPYFELAVLQGDKEITINDTIKYEILKDSEDRFETSLQLENRGNYDLNLQLDRAVLMGLGMFIDTTFWGGDFYLGANQIFPKKVSLPAGEKGADCRITFDPPYREGEFIIKLNFFEAENKNNSYNVFIKYNVVKDTGIGIDNELLTNNITIYPNPVNNILNIKGVGFLKENSVVNIKIIDINGKTLLKENILNSSSNIQLSTKDILPGIYTVVLKSGNYINYSKFIKVSQ